MKITTKTKVEELKKAIAVNTAKVKEVSEDLFGEIEYTNKMLNEDASKVTKTDLVKLVKSIIKTLGDSFIEPALAEEESGVTPKAENSLKKSLKKKGEQKVETEQSKETAEEPKADKKESTKKTPKKEKEVSVVSVLTDTKTGTIEVQGFAEEFTLEGVTYKRADDIETMEDLLEALKNDEVIYFMSYWTAKQLKCNDYFYGLPKPKSFPADVDISTALFISDECTVAYAVSSYTDAIYSFFPASIIKEDGIRMSGGVEFEIYRAV